MPWQLTAQELVEAFQLLKGPPLNHPHGWARKADYDTYSALRNLHQILCFGRVNDQDVLTFQGQNGLNPPGHPHPRTPLAHPVPPYIGGTYNTPAIALLAWQLAAELAAAFPQFQGIDPHDTDLVHVLAFVRDAEDCD